MSCPPAPSPSIPQPARTRWLGVVNGGVFLATLALGAVVYFTPLKTWLAEGETIKAHLQWFGIGAPAVFIAAAAVLTAVGLPRLLICSLGGMAFGFGFGLAWTLLATLLGSYATFLLVRWRGRAYTLDHFPRLRELAHGLESRGLMAVLLIRQLPVSGFYNTVLLALTPVSHRDFLLGSLLGFVPLGATACLLGAGLIQGDALKGVQYVALALACSVVLGYGLARMVKSRRNAVA